MRNPYFTVGHSNRGTSQFLDILRAAEVGMVVDVRRMPGSRANPQFDQDRLAEALAEFQIGYEHIASLGGLRGKAPAAPPELNGAWRNRSFHNYADFALSEEFRKGLERLVRLGQERRCAMMCSEAVWWRCHRRIISDHLLACGEKVFHLMAEGRTEKARFTPEAVVGADGSVVYPSDPALAEP